MTLYEQGKFQLDDPVANYLPEFADVQVFVEEKDDGTLGAAGRLHGHRASGSSRWEYGAEGSVIAQPVG